MRTVNNLLQASQRININELIQTAMTDTAPAYVELQKEQMFSGLDSNAKPFQRIGEFYQGYAPKTKAIKQAKGQPYDRITLKDTGSFYDGIYAEANSEGFLVESKDSKSLQLQSDYGPDIFKLDEQNRSVYAKELIAKLFALVTEKLNVGAGVGSPSIV
jgi:hypothetical protein